MNKTILNVLCGAEATSRVTHYYHLLETVMFTCPPHGNTCPDDCTKEGLLSYVSSFGTTVGSKQEMETLKTHQKLMKFS